MNNPLSKLPSKSHPSMATSYQTLPLSDHQPSTDLAVATSTAHSVYTSITSFNPLTWLSAAGPAFSSAITNLFDYARVVLAKTKPWFELLDPSAFSRPTSLSDAVSRIRKNFSYFSFNYLALLAVVLAFTILSHPFNLILLLCLFIAWGVLYLFRPADTPVVLFGRNFSDRETLALLIVATGVVIFITPVGSMFTSALSIGLGVVCIHGAFRDPKDLFIDESELPGSGMPSGMGEGEAATSAMVVANNSSSSSV